jgi:hypothetical protein
MDETKFDSVFWITITGLCITFLVAIMNTCLKSKCKKLTICCLTVERDVQAEVRQEEHEVDRNLNPYDVTRIV